MALTPKYENAMMAFMFYLILITKDGYGATSLAVPYNSMADCLSAQDQAKKQRYTDDAYCITGRKP